MLIELFPDFVFELGTLLNEFQALFFEIDGIFLILRRRNLERVRAKKNGRSRSEWFRARLSELF